MLGYEPRDSNPEIVTQSLDEKLKNPIQLSEDLLFIVDKKLRSIDKAKRDSRIEYEEGNSEEHGETRKPFTEVVYRKSCEYNMPTDFEFEYDGPKSSLKRSFTIMCFVVIVWK